jgi:mutator protein MutT
MSKRSEISAGGVVFRRVGENVEIAAGAQRDRLTGRDSLRLPKGIVEPGETPEQAAVREVSEETGLEAEVVAPLTTVSYEYDEGGTLVSKRVHFYLMRHIDGEPHPRDGEMASVHWFAADKLGDALTFDTERDVVEEAQRRLSNPAESTS